MITCLRIRNLAVVEDLEVELGPGLNVITGETGAGKTMLVKSLELIRGARSGPHLLRTGTTQATVEALLETGETSHVVRRLITANGRSRAYLDDALCTIASLTEQATAWLDISSQHEHHALTDRSSHLAWLDRYGRLEADVAAVGEAYRHAHDAIRELARFRESLADQLDKLDLLRFQLGEIERVDPSPGELDEVLQELDRLTHAESLEADVRAAAALLHSRDKSVVTLLIRARGDLSRAASRDSRLQASLDRLESQLVDVEDLSAELLDHARSLDPNPARLAVLTEREQALSRLVRRHGTLEAALEAAQSMREAIEQLDQSDDTLEQLSQAAKSALSHAGTLALALSAARQTHADALARSVTEQLEGLGMGSARIEVSLATEPARHDGLQVGVHQLTADGIDRAEFLIAPNPGEEPRPLSEVASGGELSRALLALKQVLSSFGAPRTYVFDEVDTGVGGAIAEAIGRNLHAVARHHQVICITHQAVIAAWADRHLHVRKEVFEGRTRSSIRELSVDEREVELARMLGGEVLTEGVRQAGRDLLAGARSR